MKEDGYNGWSNWETWNVNLWLDNDGYFESLRDELGTVEDDGDHEQVGELADRIKLDVEELYFDGVLSKASLAADLIGGILGRVDWDEIAAAHLEDFRE